MSRSSFSTIALSLSAGCLATLITACGTGGGQAGPITKPASPAVPTSASKPGYTCGPRSYDIDDVVTWRKQTMAQDWVDRRRHVTRHDCELDPAQRRYLARYFSDRAMSDVWQRHPELLGHPADTTDRGRLSADPERGHTADPYRQDPNTSAEAWRRRLEAVQGTGD